MDAAIIQNPDGSYTRNIPSPHTPPTPDPDSDTIVPSKDIPLNPTHHTWLRIYLPPPSLRRSSPGKLPLIVYYHGGGFVFFSAATTNIHRFCENLAAHLLAVVVSVDYRLAPEHRLPAAYDDGFEALTWLKTTDDPWLTDHVEFSKTYLMGTSAGGNIAYHVGQRAAVHVENIQPLKIHGLILHQPFFGGSERTGSEIKLANADVLTLPLSDLLWKSSLPVDEDRDHEYCAPRSDGLGRFCEVGFRVLVTGRFGDLLIDRQMGFIKMLVEKGIENVTHFGEGYHTIEWYDPSKTKELIVVIASFMSLSVRDM